jgi:ABC-type phosphate transport system substrate-binding protein
MKGSSKVSQRTLKLAGAAVVIASSVLLSACGGQNQPSGSGEGSSAASELSGSVAVDGSSTVACSATSSRV